MIVRIKRIRQVGGFRDFKTGGSIPFSDNKNITLVYGRNTLGKSTLSNIFQSIGENKPELIQKRRSIPSASGISQEVELSYKDSGAQEKTLKFETGKWQQNGLAGEIFVFDQEFAHTHVISGNSITRDNKEEFTDFILGSAGVKLSQKLENDKKQLRILKIRLPDYRPGNVKGALTEKEVDDFVNLNVDNDTPALEKEKEYQEKRFNRIDKLGDFKKLTVPEITIDSAENSTSALIKEFALILNENYNKVSDDAWKILQAHIASNCKDDHAVSWLKKGLEIKKSNLCPFCSQELSGAKTLIDTYQTIFDEKYEEYEKGMRVRIRNLESNLKLSVAKSYLSPINKFLDESLRFNPFIPELESEVEKIEEQIKKLTDIDQGFKQVLALWSQEAQELLDSKAQSLHKSIADSTKSNDLTVSSKKVADKQNDIRKIAMQIIEHINNARKLTEKYTPEQIEKEKQKLLLSIKSISTQIARLAQDKECAIYKSRNEQVINLKKTINDDTNKLESEQSDYIDKYFERLDYWFRQLGSKNFSIEKFSNRKGDKKVYSLEVKYHGVKIPSEELGKVFSESDKRNLALSVFLSKVEKLDNKKGKILVLDDPVVSFDDNRRRKTCRELKIIAKDFRQIIVTTHYGSLVRHFIEENLDSQYIQIVLENDESSLKTLDAKSFAVSPHEKECEKICLFIDGGAESVERDLRPFMEEHLHIRFQQQIAANSLGRPGLEDLINSLFELNLVNDENKDRLNAFRESFNPEHHRTPDDTNVEELRNEASELMDLLYGELK